MSNYTRQQIQALIARTRKRNNTSKSPSQQFSPKQQKTKLSNSPTSHISPSSANNKTITLRYQQLHSKYKQLVQQVKDKNHKFQLQQLQLHRLRLQRERDQKQLYRLRSMIGFIKKQDFGVQVNMDMQSTGSWNTKIQKSTAVEYQQQYQFAENPSKSYPTSLNLMKKYINSPPKQSPPLYQQNNRSAKNIKIPNYEIQLQQEQINQSYNFRVKAESIYTPKTNQKQFNTIYKLKQSRQMDKKNNKLSNSPYSKLRYSRNLT